MGSDYTIENEWESSEVIPRLVSVVMPAYNAARFIEQSISSVLSQSYAQLELIIVDDCSTDTTVQAVEEMQKKDSRIVFVKQPENMGAGAARNRAVELAKGEYMAFIDSDDVWALDKLKKQIQFMEETGATFVCSDYMVIDENGNSTGEVRKAYDRYDYSFLLKNCPGNSTVMYHTAKLGKVYIPPIRKRNDYLMWLAVIKRAGELRGIPEILTQYRVHQEGISSNKISLIKYHFQVYREIEKLSFFDTIFLVFYWGFRTLKKQYVKQGGTP